MPISDIPIFSMLRTRMQWHQERQKVLAENVANADTPNFRTARPEAARLRQPGRRRRARRRARSGSPAPTRRTSPARPGTAPSRPSGNEQIRREAGRQRREPRRRDDEGRRQPDGLSGGDLALQPQHGAVSHRARQALTEACDGLPEIDDDRGVRPARAIRPHAGDLGKHRERRTPPRSVPAPIPTGARSRPSAPKSIARSRRNTIAMGKVRQDPTDFRTKYEPGHPAADAERLRQISEREFAGRDDRHARGAAVLRGEPQRHRRDAPHDPAHHRSAARLSAHHPESGHRFSER